MTQLLTKAHDALSTVQLRVDVRVTITEQSGLVLVLFCLGGVRAHIVD